MTPFNASAERFADHLNSPSPDLTLRVQRLARLSAAGRVSEMTRSAPCLALMRLVLRASAAFPVRPGADPAGVVSLVHGSQAVGATLCYGEARRTRYLLREFTPGSVLIRTASGKESTMTRDALLGLIRGYRFTDVFVTPVPQELTAALPDRGEVQPSAEVRAAPPVQRSRPAFQSTASRWQPGKVGAG